MYPAAVIKFSMWHMSEKHQVITARYIQFMLNQITYISLDKSSNTIIIDEIEYINYNPVITGLHLRIN